VAEALPPRLRSGFRSRPDLLDLSRDTG